MGEGNGTNDANLWLNKVECAVYETLIKAVQDFEFDDAFKCVSLLERLSIV